MKDIEELKDEVDRIELMPEYCMDLQSGKLVGYDTLEEAIEVLKLIVKEEEQ